MTAKTKALVTGAARGIGYRVAERLARDGFQVLAADIDRAEVEKSAAALRDAGLPVTGHQIDISNRAAVAALFEAEKPVQVVVNCAALLPDMGLLQSLT